jgi:hypothetical protein
MLVMELEFFEPLNNSIASRDLSQIAPMEVTSLVLLPYLGATKVWHKTSVRHPKLDIIQGGQEALFQCVSLARAIHVV